MSYITTYDRLQLMICSFDSFVNPESIARLIDAFINSLELNDYGVKETSNGGRPSYNPAGMYKLYIYGNRKGIRSSRKLAESCRVNIEVKWMLEGVEPDFRTIYDFRKDNIDSLKKIFHEFNRRIAGAVNWGFSFIDGSKFSANNSKDKNFTKNKLDDRIKWLDAHMEEYLRILDDMDSEESLEESEETPKNLTREIVEAKLKEAEERLAKYKSYQKIMEETGASQLSLTDPDARLMKSKNGFAVAYNPQTAVDSETHLIRDFKMTNQVTDHGMLGKTMEGIREEEKEKILETVADRGYENSEDMLECLEKGIIPHVIMDDGKDGYELEVLYEETEVNVESTKAEEIKKCLHARKIPEAYKDVITEIRIEEVRRKVEGEREETAPKSIYGTPEEMKERAKQGYFVRDPERNLVYCPTGEILRQKCVKKNGNIRYSNKNACKHCKSRNECFKGKSEWKEIDFTKDGLEKACKTWSKSDEKESRSIKRSSGWYYEKVKIVRFTLKPSIEKMSQRMCLSEHPFGTIKRAMGASYFLLNGLRKVAGEFALFCLGYNFERAKNLLGFEKMMELMEG